MVFPADRHPQRLQLVIVPPVSHDRAAFEAPDAEPAERYPAEVGGEHLVSHLRGHTRRAASGPLPRSVLVGCEGMKRAEAMAPRLSFSTLMVPSALRAISPAQTQPASSIRLVSSAIC